jgi:pimeloyl-ACP methyl ester carboxylesterase
MKKFVKYTGLTLLAIILGVVLIFGYSDRSVDELKEKYANDQSKFMEIDGIKVHYRDEGTGVPLVLLHGTAASLHTWDGWTEALKDKYRIIRLDLPAFGLTGPAFDGDYSTDNYGRFLNAFFSEIQLDSIYLAGNSLGGHIAWTYALDNQYFVRKLILIDASGIPKTAPDPLAFRMARTPIVGSIFKYITPKSFIKENLKDVYYDDSKVTDALVEQYHDLALREGNRQAFIDRAYVVMTDRSDELPYLLTPTLLIWGKEDTWVPMSSFESFKVLIPDLQTALLDKLGHVPMEEDPKLTSKIADDFLQKKSK